MGVALFLEDHKARKNSLEEIINLEKEKNGIPFYEGDADYELDPKGPIDSLYIVFDSLRNLRELIGIIFETFKLPTDLKKTLEHDTLRNKVTNNSEKRVNLKRSYHSRERKTTNTKPWC